MEHDQGRFHKCQSIDKYRFYCDIYLAAVDGQSAGPLHGNRPGLCISVKKGILAIFHSPHAAGCPACGGSARQPQAVQPAAGQRVTLLYCPACGCLAEAAGTAALFKAEFSAANWQHGKGLRIPHPKAESHCFPGPWQAMLRRADGCQWVKTTFRELGSRGEGWGGGGGAADASPPPMPAAAAAVPTVGSRGPGPPGSSALRRLGLHGTPSESLQVTTVTECRHLQVRLLQPESVTSSQIHPCDRAAGPVPGDAVGGGPGWGQGALRPGSESRAAT